MTNPTLEDLLREENWLQWRALVPAQPLKMTELVTTEQSRAEFIEGSRILRLDERRRGGDGLSGPSPIQLMIADVLNAGHKFNGIMEPRRTTKTTSIQAVALGRCALREDYQVGWAITKKDGGTKVSERFRKDIVVNVERKWPDKRNRPFKVISTNGGEYLRWPNGSFFSLYSPSNEGFTSGAFDIAWVDEAQDASPDQTESLLTSIPPTMDGRFGAQMITSGTAPDFQDGNLLWSMLHNEAAGVLMHGIPPETDPDELTSWQPDEENPKGRVRELVELSHPGLGFNTPLSDVRDNYNAMQPPKTFHREYLGLVGTEGSNVALIPAPLWEAARQPIQKAGTTAPVKFSLVAFVDRDSLYASVASAWMGKDRKIHVALLHHQTGVQGFAGKLNALAKKHDRPITYDSYSNATDVILRERRESRTAPLERPINSKDVAKSAVHLMNQLTEGKIRHHDQEELNNAAAVAVKRAFSTGSGWAFGKPKGAETVDITGIEAVALAVYVLPQEQGKREKVQIDFFA